MAKAKAANSSANELANAYGTLGELYHAYSLLAPAQDCYLNASRLAPKDFRWVYLLAKLDHLQGRATEAVRGYQVAGVTKAFICSCSTQPGKFIP